MDANMKLISAVVIALIVIGVGFLGHYEKNKKKKFIFELIVLIFVACVVVFEGMLLLQGYFFQSARHLKRLLSAIVIVFAFIVYAEKTYENWKNMNEKRNC